MRISSAFAILFLAAAVVPANADDPVTDFVLGGIERKAESVIDHAKEAGDFLAWRMGQEALGGIKAWKESNTELLNVAFDRIDGVQRKTFNEIDVTLTRLEEGKAILVKDAEKLTIQWSGMVKNFPTVNQDPE
ncbi:hypothetical protein GR268_46785, partial [Rhizobium leguminosarum]|nr:hypothetical protein [Rhizobium leguminosarum]